VTDSVTAGRRAARRRGQGGQNLLTLQDLDELDRRIIARLQENGRQSNAGIARAVGVTEATIRYRIDRLISKGFIRVTAVVDSRKTPYQVDAIIWIRLERKKVAYAGERLAGLPNVVYVAYTSGRYDLLVEALFESDQALFDFLTTKLTASLGVVQSETYHVLRTVKINYDWKLPVDGTAGPLPARRVKYVGREAQKARLKVALPASSGGLAGADGGRRSGERRRRTPTKP
jgi:Lrp/AsnC family transcriptional regulator for asnA, asnC and gidA